MTSDKRQEVGRFRDAIQQEQDTDNAIRLLKELNVVVSDLSNRNTVSTASRQPNPPVLKSKLSEPRPEADGKGFQLNSET
jgi:hypothetical protein